MVGVVSTAWAADSATIPPNTYQVAKIEINVWGDPPKCAVLFWAYYQGELHVVDWRWCESVGIKLGVTWDGRTVIGGNVSRLLDGRYYLMWSDTGVSVTVISRERENILSRGDRELQERARLPADRRPKLKGSYSASSTPLPASSPSPTPELVDPMVAGQ